MKLYDLCSTVLLLFLHFNHLFISQVQRLYLKYFRAESFRKALVYQKRYLCMLLTPDRTTTTKIPQTIPTIATKTTTTTATATTTTKAAYRLKAVVLMVIAVGRMSHLVQKYRRQLFKSSPEYPYKDKIKNPTKKLNLDETGSGARVDVKETPLVADTNASAGGISAGIAGVKSFGDAGVAHTRGARGVSSGVSPPPPQSNLVSISQRLGKSEPLINRLHSNNNRTTDWLNQTTDAVTIATTHHGIPLDRSLDERHLRRPATSPVKSGYSGIPRSYPRSPGGVVDEFPSKLSALNNQQPGAGKISRAPKAISSPIKSRDSSPMKSRDSPIKSRDLPVDANNNLTNESLSNYIEGLEALHNRLKTVSYDDKTAPLL